MRQYTRFDRSVVEPLIKECQSYAEVLRRLGKSPVGGNVTNLRRMCIRWGIDVSNINGQSHARGKKSPRRTTPDDRLVMGSPSDHRVEAAKLRRSLLEIGVEHKCNGCGINSWMGQPLVLEIDHVDGQYWNNQHENLQFLCPNCHSQK